MGYRSDVKLVFYTSNQSEIPFPVVKLWFDENFPVREAAEDWGADIEAGQNYVLISYEGVKWYSDTAHVQAVHAATDKFCETFEANEKEGAHYEMVRVGEDLDDIERDASGWCHWLLDVRREIIFN